LILNQLRLSFAANAVPSVVTSALVALDARGGDDVTCCPTFLDMNVLLA
jgi:hypothetical protein